VLVLALARRIGMPAILGYLIVGIVLGPFAIACVWAPLGSTANANGPRTMPTIR